MKLDHVLFYRPDQDNIQVLAQGRGNRVDDPLIAVDVERHRNAGIARRSREKWGELPAIRQGELEVFSGGGFGVHSGN